ncbi:MAG TPA: hypothetical protein VG013_02225, partial [Gemmataceae bacterium]|nr:hypothetical protein [Gemmataceae bacterium]
MQQFLQQPCFVWAIRAYRRGTANEDAARNAFPQPIRRSNATRWWYFETALLKSILRIVAMITKRAMEIRHREGGR